MFIRRNDSAKAFAGHPDYKYRIGVAAPLNALDQNGLPSAEEISQLNAIEDALSVYLESEHRALQVLTVTTGGMREFVFYSKAPASPESIVLAIQAKITSHKLQSYVTEDKKWQLFAQFA